MKRHFVVGCVSALMRIRVKIWSSLVRIDIYTSVWHNSMLSCHAGSFVCFFFSSRRRHTRFDCDWSSDVCSSDLRGGYDVSLGGGSARKFKEYDLAFKIDSSANGPDPTRPALVATGRVGDRAFVVFADLEELRSALKAGTFVRRRVVPPLDAERETGRRGRGLDPETNLPDALRGDVGPEEAGPDGWGGGPICPLVLGGPAVGGMGGGPRQQEPLPVDRGGEEQQPVDLGGDRERPC